MKIVIRKFGQPIFPFYANAIFLCIIIKPKETRYIYIYILLIYVRVYLVTKLNDDVLFTVFAKKEIKKMIQKKGASRRRRSPHKVRLAVERTSGVDEERRLRCRNDEFELKQTLSLIKKIIYLHYD